MTAAICAAGNTSAQELVPLGALPKLAADWKISAADRHPDSDDANRLRWIVFRNKGTGDLLSLATHPELGKKSLKGQQVLEYCFVSESPDQDNLMAHGRTWVGPKFVVFVQHTSAKPITSDFVDQIIASIIRDQMTRGARESRE
jgi:hypothetical protein